MMRGMLECTLAGIGLVSGELSVPRGGGAVPTYSGPYDVTPRAHTAVILETDGLLMTDDVTVRKIPYYETSNPTGSTIYIANEV